MEKIRSMGIFLGKLSGSIAGKMKKQSNLLFLLLLLLAVSVATVQESFGRFRQTLVTADLAQMAQLDVVFVMPEGFLPEEDIYEHYFITSNHVKTLYFQVKNQGEVDVFCTPYVSEEIQHIVVVEGDAMPEFFVARGETQSFQLILLPIGITTSPKDVELFLDVRQV